MTLEEMMRLGEEQARRVLIGTKEDLLPSWMLADGEGKVTIVATPWRNNDEKTHGRGGLREAMRGMRNRRLYSAPRGLAFARQRPAAQGITKDRRRATARTARRRLC